MVDVGKVPAVDLGERLLDFGASLVVLTRGMPQDYASHHITKQLLRSGTSAGANYEEAQAAESSRDFVHKLQIALKECREAYYWLRLLQKSNTKASDDLDHITDEARQLRAMLSKGVAKAKSPSPP